METELVKCIRKNRNDDFNIGTPKKFEIVLVKKEDHLLQLFPSERYCNSLIIVEKS